MVMMKIFSKSHEKNIGLWVINFCEANSRAMNSVCNHVITKEMKIVSPPLHPFYIYRIGNTNNIMSRKYVCVTRILLLCYPVLSCWGNCVGNNFYENHLQWVALGWAPLQIRIIFFPFIFQILRKFPNSFAHFICKE